MPEETSVQINFGASTDEAIAGIAQIREALSGLTAPVAGLSGTLTGWRRVRRGFAGGPDRRRLEKGRGRYPLAQSETDAKIVAMAAKAHGELQ